MRILETISETLQSQRAHPTTVLNALIELENDGGASALYELEYRLARMTRTLFENRDSSHRVAKAWLEATRAYLETYAPAQPIPLPSARKLALQPVRKLLKAS